MMDNMDKEKNLKAEEILEKTPTPSSKTANIDLNQKQKQQQQQQQHQKQKQQDVQENNKDSNNEPEDILVQKIVERRLSIHQTDEIETKLAASGSVKPAASSLPSNAQMIRVGTKIAKYAMTDESEKMMAGSGTRIAKYAMTDESEKMAQADSSNPEPLRLQRSNHNNSMVASHPGAYHVAHPDSAAATSDEESIHDDDDDDDDYTADEHVPEAASVPLDATLVVDGDDSHTKQNEEGGVADANITNNTHTSDNNKSANDLTIMGKAVTEVDESMEPTRRLQYAGIVFLMLIVIVLLSLGLSGVFSSDRDNDTNNTLLDHDAAAASNTIPNDNVHAATTNQEEEEEQLDSSVDHDTRSTLQMIRDEGLLRCGYRHLPVANGDIEGFLGVMCEVVAAAIFGINSTNTTQTLPGTNNTITRTVPVEFVKDTPGSIFDTLHQKQIHLKTFGYTHNMERNVFREEVQSGFAFSVPFLYEGMRLAGDPFYVQCAENNLHHINECQDLKICVGNHSTYHTLLQQLLPRRNIAVMPYIGLINHGLVEGSCNLLSGSSFLMATNQTIYEAGYTGKYLVSNTYSTKEPLGVVTRPDDPEWSDFVNAIMMALLVAEQQNITRDSAHMLFPQTDLFGEDYKNMFRNAIGYAGNFGEIYQNMLEYGVPRVSLNWINDGSSGLMYSHPFGDFEVDRGDVPLSDKMNDILTAGVVRCGIRLVRPGLATKDTAMDDSYSGMEVDYCKALSAGLFGGSTTYVEYVELVDQRDGFQKLASGMIDVFAGATWTLENDVREPTTGIGFAFTKPYFYGYSNEEDNFAMATMQDDHDWSTFVLWIVMGTIHAEEEGIGSAQSNDMPEVFLYGYGLKRMFRDSILGVGNYGDIYQRNLQSQIPRANRNLLNTNPNLGGQHYIIPGFF